MMLRRLLFAILLGMLLELPLWLTSTHAKGADQADSVGAGLYMLEPQNGRTLLQLDGVTLDTMPTGAITLGGPSSRLMLSPPEIVASPGGSMFAITTQRCPGCAPPIPVKYITVRVISRQGVVLHRFHPAVNLTISGVSDDGSQVSSWGTEKTASGYVTAWYTLSATTGHIVHTLTLPHGWNPLYDPVRDRLYTSDTTADHHLVLTAYSVASGQQIGQLTVPDIAAGSWNTDQQFHGYPVIHIDSPGVALSPDGSQIAVFDGQAEKLVTVDAPAMRVLRTEDVSRPQSLLDRVAGVLGLAPAVAEAKGMAEGISLSVQFGNDGKTLYVTGETYGPDSKGMPSSQSLGLERIDLTSGQLTATALKGESVRWLAEGADGQALYALSPEDHGFCPCALRRLDPVSLQTTAQRMIQLDWNLQLFVLRDPNA